MGDPKDRGPADLPRLTTIGATGTVSRTGASAGGGASPWFFAGRHLVIWSFKLGQFLRGIYDGGPDAIEREREAGEERLRDEWRRRMRDQFWSEFNNQLAEVRERAFDDLAGGHASHGVVPRFSVEALRNWIEMTDEISDGWKEKLEDIGALEEYVRKGVNVEVGIDLGPGPWPYEGRRSVIVSGIEDARRGIRRLREEMAKDLHAVEEWEADPAHWELTPEQEAQLAPAWRERFELRRELEHEIDHGSPTLAAGAQAADQLHRLEEEMGAEARDLYEFGPRVSPEDQPAPDPPTYGPEPPPQYGPPSPKGRS